MDMGKMQAMKSMMQTMMGMMDEMMGDEGMEDKSQPIANKMAEMKSRKEMSM